MPRRRTHPRRHLPAISNAEMDALVNNVMNESEHDTRLLTASARKLLRSALEIHAKRVFRLARVCMEHDGDETIAPAHMQLARRLMGFRDA